MNKLWYTLKNLVMMFEGLGTQAISLLQTRMRCLRARPLKHPSITMQISETIADIRQSRWANPNLSWGLVPTMGFLHAGHLSLVERARQENDRVGVSIFVNPTQFNEAKDLEVYPRDMARDLTLLKEAGVDLVWTPEPETVYPPNYQTHVEVEEVTQLLEGAARPGHFRGVTTVVAKLFNVFQPNRAYFGQKDAQQVAVIKQMVRDLNVNLDVVVCPIARDHDGLALSSRNSNLSPEAREQATCLYRALTAAQTTFAQGERNAEAIHLTIIDLIASTPLARLDYVSVANPVTLIELETITDQALLSMAVFVDNTRLIDNMIIGVVRK
ncbi:pantoate--beta-alanine ligase [Anaerolineales bacterium HSG25]|nr:pantoate--beta-alanine ligase [Anaerolineales bacterium HSG25]